MQAATALLTAVMALTGPLPTKPVQAPRRPPATAPAVTIGQCLVALIEEAQVPAEEAGQLVELAVREGSQVKAGDLLARIDDLQARLQQKAAQHKFDVAKEKADTDVNYRYSVAAAAVARAEYDQAVESNKMVHKTVPQAEVRRLLLTYERTKLEIEQAQMEQRIAGLESKVAEAEVEATAEGLDRRVIKAPIDGVVVERRRNLGEWVQPGDPVLHLVRVDRLRIKGMLNVAENSPSEVEGKPVTVVVQFERGRTETFQGKIVFTDPRVGAGGDYEVWAEVLNRKVNDHWLLRPGLFADMTIHISPGPGGVPSVQM